MTIGIPLFPALGRLVPVGLLAAGLLTTPTAEAQLFHPETFTLDNGMRVVVVTNRSAPVVSHSVWYAVGAADEPPGLSGIAHFVEHMMFRGTETVPDGEFNRTVSRFGAQSNAFTSWDYTGYFQNVATDQLPLMMELEADRMVHLTLELDAVLPERDVILQERLQVVDNRPQSRLNEQAGAALYQNHPYGIPIIGWYHEIERLSQEDLRAFYEAWYAPNNAVLIVTGDIDVDALRPLAEATYGQIPPRPVPERLRPMEPEDRAVERRVVVRDPGVTQPSWQRYYLAPSSSNDPDGHAYALQVLDELFGTGSSSRLYRALVIEQGVAVSAGGFYSASGLDYGTLGFWGVPAGNATPDAVEAAIDAEIARLLADGVTEEEVDGAIQRLLRQAVFARDSLFGPARSLGVALTTGRTVEDVEAWPERIAAVTPEQVMAAARAVLDVNRSVTGLLLPGEGPDLPPLRSDLTLPHSAPGVMQ